MNNDEIKSSKAYKELESSRDYYKGNYEQLTVEYNKLRKDYFMLFKELKKLKEKGNNAK